MTPPGLDGDGVVELSDEGSSEDEDVETSSGSVEEEEEEEEDEEEGEEGSDCSDSSDASLGQIIESMGGAAALGINMIRPVKRSTSMSNINMQIEADVEPDSIEDEQQRESLLKFMERMQNAADSYFQAPEVNNPNSRMPPRSSSAGAIEDIRRDAQRMDNPSNYFLDLVKGEMSASAQDTGELFHEKFWEDYFLPITEERRKAYKPHVVAAIRAQDMETLKSILVEEGDASMEACNAQGETLLHLACRRRNYELVKFLIITAHVSAKVRDDFGKTPLHEICWYTEPGNPSQFDSVEFLLVCAPEMFFAKDKRGYTPLQYAPKASWKDWCRFLSRNRGSIRSKVRAMMLVR